MSARYDCTDAAQRAAGINEAAASLRKGDLVVMPTDTVYGLAADAFSPVAVASLLAAKGRGRHMPPPVLVGSVRAATALAEDLNASGRDLIEEFWPGGLTLVLRANRGLLWDLGETKGTVAVRMPLHQVALELLKEVGPLAVSSANLSGAPAATTAAEAEAQLGEAVAVYLDGGPCAASVPSTIVDLTGPVPRLLRPGVISVERIRRVATLAVDEDAMLDQADAPELSDAPPDQDDAPPDQDDAPPAQDDAPPAQDDAPPAQDDAPPAQDDAAPAQDDAAPAQDDPAPVQDDPAPVQDDPAPVQDDPAPVQDDAPPVQDDAAPVQDDGPLDGHGTRPREGGAAAE